MQSHHNNRVDLSNLHQYSANKIKEMKGNYLHISFLNFSYYRVSKLRSGQIEAIGFVFSHVTYLNLQSNHLTDLIDNKIQELGEALPHLTTLNLSFNSLGDLIANQIKLLKGVFSRVTFLNAACNGLSKWEADQFQALGEAFPNLTYLNLFNNHLILKKDIIQALGKAFPHLTKLSLSKNNLKLTPGIIQALGKALPKLTKLDLSHNALILTVGKIQKIGKALPKLTKLDLSHNDLILTPAIMQALIEAFPNLTELNLSGNEISRMWTEKKIHPVIEDSPHHLISLDLSCIHLNTLMADQIKLLKGIFSSVTFLDVSGNFSSELELDETQALKVDKIQALGEVFPHLTELNLSHNHLRLTVDKIQKLGKAFPNLTSLNLSYNHLILTPDKIQALIEAFPHLTELNLSSNNLSSWTEKEIHHLIEGCPDLRNLILENTKLSPPLRDLLVNQLLDQRTELTSLAIDTIDEALANQVKAAAFRPGDNSCPGNMINIIDKVKRKQHSENHPEWANILQQFPVDIADLMDKFRLPVSVTVGHQTIPPECVKSSKLNDKANHRYDLTPVSQSQNFTDDESDEFDTPAAEVSKIESPSS